MEHIIIQDCGCIALPESIATALDLRREMTLEVALNGTGDAVLLTPRPSTGTLLLDDASQPLLTTICVILPPSR